MIIEKADPANLSADHSIWSMVDGEYGDLTERFAEFGKKIGKDVTKNEEYVEALDELIWTEPWENLGITEMEMGVLIFNRRRAAFHSARDTALLTYFRGDDTIETTRQRLCALLEEHYSH